MIESRFKPTYHDTLPYKLDTRGKKYNNKSEVESPLILTISLFAKKNSLNVQDSFRASLVLSYPSGCHSV